MNSLSIKEPDKSELSESATAKTRGKRSPLYIACSAVACIIAILLPWSLPWHYVVTLLVLCAMSCYVLRALPYIRLASCALGCFFCALMLSEPSQTDKVFFCECTGFVERIYLNDFSQRIRLRVADVDLPSQRIARFKKISCQLPLSPVLRPGDCIRIRGLCYGEQREFYYRWLLRAQDVQIEHYREQGARSAVWKSIDAMDRYQSVATALVLGIPSYQDQEQFRQAGIAHMLAVSGLHVGIIFLLAAVLLRFIAVPWYLRCFALIILVLTYLWLTGMAIPTQRAAIMAVVLICAQLCARHLRAYAALGLAAMIIICIHPYDVLSAGFQLSFVAVAGILYFGLALRRQRMHYLPLMAWPLDTLQWRAVLWLTRNSLDALCIGLAASLAVTPLLVWHFQVLNPWSPLASVLVTPAVSAVIMSAFVLSVCEWLWSDGPWFIVTAIMQGSLDGLMWIRELLAQWPGSQIEVSTPSAHIFLIWPLVLLWGYMADRRLSVIREERLRKQAQSHAEQEPLIHGLPVL